MPQHIKAPTIVEAAGTKPKQIHEFIGRQNSGTQHISIAHMKSPSGWQEPGQRPEFEEYTYVLRGFVRVETERGEFDVQAGEIFIANKGEWVRYSTPGPEGADYIAVCTPAFSMETVHRDE